MSPFIFPLEIEENILDLLAEDDKGHSALKMCSLVCQAFLRICRKHIFGSIVLGPRSTHAFERLLRETPVIADYIRILDCEIESEYLKQPPIQKTLKRISKLEFLTFHPGPYHSPRFDSFHWSDNGIRPALLHLLHLPTLKHFKITHINNFLVSDLIPCVNLKYLDIGIHTTVAAENTFPASFPEHSIQLNKFVAGTRTSDSTMKFCAARRPDGQPIIDFGSLSQIRVDVEGPNDEVLQELFRRCHALTTVRIFFWEPQNVRPRLADMLRPSMQTLKHIVVDIDVDHIDDDLLFGIPSDLEVMGTSNIIETVTIGILLDTGANCWPGDGLGRLDEALTSPGWFSLKRVAIGINCYGSGVSEAEVAFRKWPERQFPRLSSSNSVSFDLKVNG